jgi:hypothetical protein
VTRARGKTPTPEMFRSARQFVAWIGVTPKDHSKPHLCDGVLSRACAAGAFAMASRASWSAIAVFRAGAI